MVDGEDSDGGWSLEGLVETFTSQSESVLGGYHQPRGPRLRALPQDGNALGRCRTRALRRYLSRWRPARLPPPINSSPSVTPSMTTILSLVSSRTYKIVDYVEADTTHLSAPGLGVEFGSTHDHVMYALFQVLEQSGTDSGVT